MKQIVWVFGTSASGKETFIQQLLSNNSLQQTFELEDGTLQVSKESLKNLGKLDGSRMAVVAEATHLIQSSDVVLIKWQYGDTLLSSPNVLQKLFPNYRHLAINLNVETSDQIQRIRSKPWWHDLGKEEPFIRAEIRTVKDSLAQLDSSIQITNYNWANL